jgi:hypothetical protein
MNKAIQHYAETLKQERNRIAGVLCEPLEGLGYRLLKVDIFEGQGVIHQDVPPYRSAIEIRVSAKEINGDGE